MQNTSIIVQIVSSTIMAFSSIAMLVVSGFLFWNALKIRRLNENNNKIAAWEIRWQLYNEITTWPISIGKYLNSPELITNFSSREAAEEMDLSAIEIASAIKKSKLLFHKDPVIVTFLEKYHHMITPLIQLEIGKDITAKEINRSLTRFIEWINQDFHDQVENNFLNILSLDY